MSSITKFAAILLILGAAVSGVRAQNAPVTLKEDGKTWTMDNGIVTAIVAKESGDLVSLKFKGLEILATQLTENGAPDLDKDPPGENRAGLNRGMTDHQYGFWSHDAMGPRGSGDAIPSVTIDPAKNGGQRAEVAVKGISNGRLMGTGPGAGNPGNFISDIEIRWALGRGDSGVYTYCQFEHKPEYARTVITEARFCAKLADYFDWMSVAPDEHHNKLYPASLREGDKYIYTANQFNNRAFGWSSTTKNVGFFEINASMEYMSGGPTKVEFLGHRDTNAIAAPCVLNYWRSSHYGGAEVAVNEGEHWVKVIGPFMLYVNSGANAAAMYEDARNQAVKEAQKWPYDWVNGVDYPTSKDRATVSGQLVLHDSQKPGAKLPNLMVGLTAAPYTSAAGGPGGPRTVGWQQDAKNYEFWVKGAEDGKFVLPNVRPGSYTMYAFADGVLGEYVQADVKVDAGKPLNMGQVNWTPVRKGKQIWEVGIPNRYGSEFAKGDLYWQVGIGQVYAKDYPDDITFTIGKSDISKDWFFQHVPKYDPALTPPGARGGFTGPPANGAAAPRTIVFDMPSAGKGKATLRVALSATSVRAIEVSINGDPAGQLGPLPGDGALASHGMHGIWRETEFVFDGSLLKQGQNKLTLTVPAGSVTSGVIYDYLRLELDDSAQAAAN